MREQLGLQPSLCIFGQSTRGEPRLRQNTLHRLLMQRQYQISYRRTWKSIFVVSSFWGNLDLKHITHTRTHTVYLPEIFLRPHWDSPLSIFWKYSHYLINTRRLSLDSLVSCEHQPCPASSHRTIWPSRASINHLSSLGFHVSSLDFPQRRQHLCFQVWLRKGGCGSPHSKPFPGDTWSVADSTGAPGRPLPLPEWALYFRGK